MKVNGKPYRTIFLDDDGWRITVIDQTVLPHEFRLLTLASLDDAGAAIKEMKVRGAPLIGATAAYGIALAMRGNASDAALAEACAALLATRPTAVNLRWAIDEMQKHLIVAQENERVEQAYRHAAKICDDDVALCSAIGDRGLPIIEALSSEKKGEVVNILTHCNAGWLGCVDWGTALAPIYKAHNAGINVHVWVDETRPRNQGFNLTAWELSKHGVPNTLIVDNAGGHLMQHGLVDMCIVGTDRTTRNGDVCNKIGTYLKALAAQDNDVPFYVALPGPTIDWSMRDGLKEIPIEERHHREVTHIVGRDQGGNIASLQLAQDEVKAANFGFDVTPARLVTALITERGITSASEHGLLSLYPEFAALS